MNYRINTASSRFLLLCMSNPTQREWKVLYLMKIGHTCQWNPGWRRCLQIWNQLEIQLLLFNLICMINSHLSHRLLSRIMLRFMKIFKFSQRIWNINSLLTCHKIQMNWKLQWLTFLKSIKILMWCYKIFDSCKGERFNHKKIINMLWIYWSPAKTRSRIKSNKFWI